MPVKYVCKHCGYVLWEFNEVGQDYYGIPTPEEVIRVYGGICPRCKSDLSIPSMADIMIKPMGKYTLLSQIEKTMSERSSMIQHPIIKNYDFVSAQEA